MGLSNVIDLQYTIADQIITYFLGDKEGSVLPKLDRKGTANPEAAALQIKGMYLLNRLYDTGEKSDIEQAETAFKQALDIDNRFAEARVGLAEAYWQYINFGYSDDSSLLTAAMVEIEKALAVDGDSYEAYLIQTKILAQQGKKDDAIAAFRKAVRLAPNAVEVWKGALILYKLCGLYKRAEAIWHKIAKYSANPTVAQAYIAYFLMYQGHFVEARNILEHLLSLEPTNVMVIHFLASAYYYTGQYERSLEIYDIMGKKLPDTIMRLGILGMLSAATGQREKAVEYATTAHQFGEIDFDKAYQIASIHALLGDEPNTIIWLRKMLTLGCNNYPFLLLDPSFESMRKSPTFQSFVDILKKDWESHRDLKFFDWEE
jgi:tetratricopeptide (TPR) repeat protein